jgi:hypothetical protein
MGTGQVQLGMHPAQPQRGRSRAVLTVRSLDGWGWLEDRTRRWAMVQDLVYGARCGMCGGGGQSHGASLSLLWLLGVVDVLGASWLSF